MAWPYTKNLSVAGFVAVELGASEMVLEFMGYGSPLEDDIIPLYITRIPRVAISLGRRRRALLRRELAGAGAGAAGLSGAGGL